MKKNPTIPTIRIEAKAKKPAKAKVKAKKQPKPRTVGAPPLDATPPYMKDTRPKAKPVPVATPEPAKPVSDTPRPIPAQPKTVPADRLTGRMVQGLNCTWLGDMAEAGGDPNGQPLCPYCNSPLLTAMDMATIVLGVKAYELGAYDSVNPPPRPHPGYVAFFDWMHKSGKCYPSIMVAAAEYEAQTGNKVDPTR